MIYCAFVVHDVPSRTEIIEMTDRCLKTFKETIDCEKVSLIIIDNGSNTDRVTPVALKYMSGFASTHLITTPSNLPIAECWNKVIEDKQQGDVIVLLNNDVVFNRKGWLDELIRPLFQSSTGAAGGKLMSWNGFTFLEGSFLAFTYDTAQRIKNSNDKVFDEQFLFTCEEADFCIRLQNAGLQLVETSIERNNMVTHLHHGTLSWSNEENGWNGESILNVMHECRRKLCRKYGKPEYVND